jgi:hypothetical protein
VVIAPGERLAEFSFRFRILLVPDGDESVEGFHRGRASVVHFEFLAVIIKRADQAIVRGVNLFDKRDARLAIDQLGDAVADEPDANVLIAASFVQYKGARREAVDDGTDGAEAIQKLRPRVGPPCAVLESKIHLMSSVTVSSILTP